MLDWFEVFGRLHPLIVHLPIGFLLALAALELVAYSQRSSLPRATVSVVVWLAALAAVFASVTGYVLSREEGYGTSTVLLHLRLGIAVAVLSVALAIVHLRANEGTRGAGLAAYRVLLVVAVLLLLPTGHLGGKIARGENYVMAPLHQSGRAPRDRVLAAEPAPKPATKPGAGSATNPDGSPDGSSDRKTEDRTPGGHPEKVSFATEIAPILSARCVACHGETKQKGGLSLADPNLIVDGGRNGVVIVPGEAAESEMVRRMRLPAEDEDHMPPPEKPQPTEEEIARVEKWIAVGAEFDVPGAPKWTSAEGAQGGDGIGAGSDSDANLPPNGATAGVPGVAPADPAALEALRSRLVHVEPLARDSSLLVVSFAAAAKETGDGEAITLLEPILTQVADLSLARSKIGDATMKLAARMPNLSRLDVRDTEVTDAGVAEIAKHTQLGELVLVRTHLTDAAVESLLAMPELKKVFVWNSGLSVQALGRLRFLRPDLMIEAGAAADARPIETEKEVVLKKPVTASGAPGGTTAPVFQPATSGSPASVNTVCPVTGKPVNPAYQVVFKGKAVGFCCPKCPSTFLADPAKYESKLP